MDITVFISLSPRSCFSIATSDNHIVKKWANQSFFQFYVNKVFVCSVNRTDGTVCVNRLQSQFFTNQNSSVKGTDKINFSFSKHLGIFNCCRFFNSFNNTTWLLDTFCLEYTDVHRSINIYIPLTWCHFLSKVFLFIEWTAPKISKHRQSEHLDVHNSDQSLIS